ncbi:MAG: DsbA family protein [Pseudomonadota bacterium]
MNTRIAIGLALMGAVILGAVISGFGVAQQPAPQAEARADNARFDDAQAEEIENIVRDYLLDNPEIIIESISLYQDRERERAVAQLEGGARKNLKALINGDGGYTVGAAPEKAKVAVIEFFDYHCGYCKRATGLVQDLTRNDPDVKVVFRELPLLREESLIAAEYALAARAQNKYTDLHFALMNAQGTLTEDRVKQIAKKAGLKVNELEKAVKDPSVKAAVQESLAFARDMGADGTPTFIVASLNSDFIKVMPGFSKEGLLAAIEEAKKQ